MSGFLDVLRDAAPVLLGVFLVYLAFAVPRWIARGLEQLLDWVTTLWKGR